MKTMRRISSLLLALLLVLSLAVTAFAADSSVSYTGHKLFEFNPGSEYTLTDLFDNFKGVMPGDVLTETITVTNRAYCCDYIKVYLYARTHGDGNKMNDTLYTAGETSEVSMNDFLAQLNMKVWNKNTLIYDASPNLAGGLENKVFLGEFYRGKGTELKVELKVPHELGNAYANREGEVDWVFVVEEYNNGVPKTGDETSILPYVLMLAVGMTGMVILIVGKRRRRN